MATLTVAEMREKTKEKRSRAVTGLINVIKTRDGSTSPPIEGLADVDDFNLSMLFGPSQNENIIWNNMGVEGLIRLYYDIIEKINGITRENIVTNTTITSPPTIDSSLDFAAKSLIKGTYGNSGFFTNANNKPEYDLESPSFLDNGEIIPGDPEGLELIIEDINAVLGIIITDGPHATHFDGNSGDWSLDIVDTIMGHRWSDVCPVQTGQGSVDDPGDPIGPPIIPPTYNTNYTFGDGERDDLTQTPLPVGFTLSDYQNYWDSTIELLLPNLITELIVLIVLIEYSKIISDDYFTNPNVILGRDENPQFYTQDTWITQINEAITAAQNIIDEIVSYPLTGGGLTQASRRIETDDFLVDLRIKLNTLPLTSIIATFSTAFGDVNTPSTLYGFRFLWIKNIIDPNDGSKSALKGLATAIDTMNANIEKAEGEFGLYGLDEDEWIPIPEIVGIQIYYLPNETTFEMEAVGYLLAWVGQDHVTSYNVEKSTDWNGSSGSWSPLAIVDEVDANTGRVLTYYIDEDVDIEGGSKPFYRVKAYDTGGSGDMSRIAAESAIGDPKNVDDFPEGGETVPVIPGSPPPPDPITVPTIPETVPEGTLIWTTILERDDAEDVDHTFYKSEVPFDSSGTNLVVYVNGELRNRGAGEDYTIVDYYTIKFNAPIAINDEITMNVFIRDPDEPTTSWKDPVSTNSQLPQQSNSEGDIRLVIDENSIYMWDGTSSAWVLISASSGDVWGQPVDNIVDLPVAGNDGEVRFVITEQSLYYYNGSQSQWLNVASQSMKWKDPVQVVGDLPAVDNTTGDVRLVLDESKLYLWNGTDWSPIVADLGSVTINHGDLDDMPDLAGSIGDHDERYYTETEINITVSDLQDQINALLNLVPNDADVLTGTFRYSGTIFRTGHLSHGAGSFVTLIEEQNFTRITKDTNFTILNPDPDQFNNADEGVLKLYINNIEVDSFDLGAAFVEAERNIGQIYPPDTSTNGFIKIIEVGPYANYPSYQKGEFEIYIESADLVTGENKIKLIHELTSETRETDDLILFWDNYVTQIGFQSIDVQHENITTTKYLSGIRHYSLGDQLRVTFTGLRLFDNTYTMPNQIKINPLDFGSGEHYVNYQSAGSSGVALPEVGEVLYYDNIIVIDTLDIYKSNPRLGLTGYDPHGPSDVFYTPYLNILVNTYGTLSDDKNEYFVDEYYRLDETLNYDTVPVATTNQWNSQTQLTAGQLQVFNSSVVYPNTNFNAFLPSQAINYTGLTGDRYYIRAFKDVNPHNNGTFFIEGFNINDSDVKIYLKLPSQTGWLDISAQYNAGVFTGIDGDGCLINRSGYYLEWTSEAFSTANSGYIIMLRIIMLNSNSSSVSQISIDW